MRNKIYEEMKLGSDTIVRVYAIEMIHNRLSAIVWNPAITDSTDKWRVIDVKYLTPIEDE